MASTRTVQRDSAQATGQTMPAVATASTGSLTTSSDSHSVAELTPIVNSAPANQIVLSPGQHLLSCCSQCLVVAAAISLLVVAIMNLNGSLNDLTTGAIFIGGAGFTIALNSFMLHHSYTMIKNVAGKAIADVLVGKKIVVLSMMTSIIALAGGILGVTGVINNQTLGWFYIAPFIVSCPLSCIITRNMKSKLMEIGQIKQRVDTLLSKSNGGHSNADEALDEVASLAKTHPDLIEMMTPALVNSNKVQQVASRLAPTHPDLVRQLANVLQSSHRDLADQLTALLPRQS